MLIIYTTPSCSSCRKAKKWLDEHRIEYYEKNIFHEKLTEEDLDLMLTRTENGFSDIISTRSKVIRENEVILNELTVKEAKKFIDVNFNLKDSADSLKILNNSGNITNVAILENLNDKEFEKYSNYLLNLNSLAERNQHYSSPIKIKSSNSKHDNLYFVSDKYGKIYFSKTQAEQDRVIASLKKEGKWFIHDNK